MAVVYRVGYVYVNNYFTFNSVAVEFLLSSTKLNSRYELIELLG